MTGDDILRCELCGRALTDETSAAIGNFCRSGFGCCSDKAIRGDESAPHEDWRWLNGWMLEDDRGSSMAMEDDDTVCIALNENDHDYVMIPLACIDALVQQRRRSAHGTRQTPTAPATEPTLAISTKTKLAAHKDMGDWAYCAPEKSAAEQALDDIAKLCGCPQWEYPGQVVRDVCTKIEQLGGPSIAAQLDSLRKPPGDT